MAISSDKTNNKVDIYISNKENIIEDELILYLEEKRIDKKVSYI